MDPQDPNQQTPIPKNEDEGPQVETPETLLLPGPDPTAPDSADVAAPVDVPVVAEQSSADPVSDEHFEKMVLGAIESVGGSLLFKVKVVDAGETMHAAAASVGVGDSRQFLLLTLPASGGRLKVETVSRSQSPLARIAESYAGLMDVLKVAA